MCSRAWLRQPLAGERRRTRCCAQKINSANGLLRGGDVDAAITAYRQAQEQDPKNADLSYNLAVAQYRKGDVSAAERLFQTTAAAENDALAAKSRYNLGNCKFAAALRDAEKDRPTAIKSLESAIANYRSALDIEPADADARANIERAAALIDKLRKEDEKEQQRQQQQGDKQDEAQQKNNQQSNEQQKDQQQQTQDKQQQQAQSSSADKSQDNQPDQEQQPQAGDESKNKDSSQAQSSQQNQSGDPQKDQQQGSQSDKQPQSQQEQPDSQSAGEQKQQDKKTPPPQSQQNRQETKFSDHNAEQDSATSPEQPNDKQGKTLPKGALTAAGNETKDEKHDAESQVLESVKEGEMTTQEAEKMLQSIRDREMLRRLRRQAAERDRHVPVDRDW